MNIPPNQTPRPALRVLAAGADAAGALLRAPSRVDANFSSWVERKDGKVEIIYQSFDWMDMPTFRYDSVVQNPTPSFDKRIDGATSGILTLDAGDKLHFNCHIEYTEARAQEEGAPVAAHQRQPALCRTRR